MRENALFHLNRDCSRTLFALCGMPSLWTRRLVLGIGICLAGAARVGTLHAASVVYTIPMTPTASQLSQRVVIDSQYKYVWDSGMLTISPVKLYAGDTLTFNLNFTQALQATDLASYPDASEMIYWAMGGSGTLAVSQTMHYQWQFLSTSGELLAATIPGDGVLRPIPGQVQGVINPSQYFETLNLTDSSFTFAGLSLTVSIPYIASGWTVNFCRIDFASDDLQIVPIPEPAFGSLAGLSVAALACACRRRQRSPLLPQLPPVG